MGKALHRRDFIRKAGLASGAAVLSPYWLNAINRLSHSENKPHVVLCILGGGVRKSDTLGMQWGNLMPHLFVGSRPIDGRLASSMPQLPRVFERPLQEQGTLFTQLRYAKGAISHSIAHHALLTGSYSNQHYSSYEKPNKADIFDVLSQELGFAEIEDMGWMANTLGRYEAIGGRFTINAQFQKWGTASPSNFLQETERTLDAWGLGTLKIFEDLRSIAAVSHYINAKRPKFVAFNLQGADCCHYNFTQYCANVHAVDYALARMWQGIQETPQLAGNTVLIIVPDHGRNTRPNLLEDENDLAGYDHYDEDARESFCLIAGPTQRVPQCAIIETSVQTIDVAPTVAQILGVEAHKLAQHFEGQSLLEHVVRA
jgi:hypothetical protein